MSLLNVFDIAGSGMSAQTVRLNTTASNLSNAETPASSADTAYRARYPIFKAVQQQANSAFNHGQSKVSVQVSGIYEDTQEPRKIYQPGNQLADKDGYVYMPNVSAVEQMADMISASRTYQMNVQVMTTAKTMLQRTLQLGQ